MKRLLLFGSLLLLVAAACGGRNHSRTTAAETSWTLVIGTQGGFTGGGGGNEIHSDGLVLAWTRLSHDDDRETSVIGWAAVEQLAALAATLRAPELQTLEFRESGNLTRFMELRVDDTGLRNTDRRDSLDTQSQGPTPGTRAWSWPADRMGGRTPKVPTLIRECYEQAQAVVDAVELEP